MGGRHASGDHPAYRTRGPFRLLGCEKLGRQSDVTDLGESVELLAR